MTARVAFDFTGTRALITGGTNATPNRAVRVGYTQSNISTPSATQTTRSSG
jgi:hypothetical protein